MTLRFIDTHCHFDFPPFTGDETASIARAAQAGVRQIIVPATEADNFARVLGLAAQYAPLYAALGLHPIVIERHEEESLARLEACLAKRDAKLIAVGEIGLDLYREDPQFERQISLLEAQLRLAKRYDLPVILHSRRTHDKLAMLLKSTLYRVPAWCTVLPVVFSKPNVLSSWAIKSALAVPLPTRAPARPAM